MLYRLFPLGLLLALLVAPISPLALQARPEEPAATDKTPDLARARRLILDSTNQFRKDHGKPKLTENAKLTRAAQDFAEFMARTDKYGHTADGKQPWDRVTDQKYDYCIAAENIAYEFDSEGFSTGELSHEFMKGWENSPPHRENLLNENLQEIGIGLAHSDKTGRYYAVQDFGRPKSAEIAFRVENDSKDTVHYTVDGKPMKLEPRTTMTHRACTPPELRFEQPGTEKPGEKAYHPVQGERYVVQSKEGGGFTVEKQAAGASSAK